jgi:error-prone DNA polymerase
VIHVIATHLTDASASLDALSDAECLVPQIARADLCNRPKPDVATNMRAHPRDVRIIPKSRDFH